MKKHILIVALVVVVAAIIWGALGSLNNGKASTTKIGYLAIAGALPLFVAEQEGYFRDAGVEVELVQFRSSNEIAIAAANGEIDVISIGATNAVLDAGFTSNTEFRAFLLNGYTDPDDGSKPSDYLLARPGVTLENLAGKNVAFFPGSISKVFAGIVFPKYGLSLDQVSYIEMAPPNWQSALASGAVDAVTAVEPFATQIMDNELAEPIISGYYAQVMPDVPLSAGWFVQGHLDKAQEKTIVSVYERAVAFIEQNPEKAVLHFKSYTSMDDAILKRIGLNRWRLTSDSAAAQSMAEFIEILERHKAIKGVKGAVLWTDSP